MDARIETVGLREFRRDLKKLDREIDKELVGDIRRAGGTYLTEARTEAPMKSGALAKSLKLSVTTRGVSIYSTVPYAGVVHWGGTIAPRGAPITFERTEFISKAVDRGADRLVDELSDSVEQAAKRAGWR